MVVSQQAQTSSYPSLFNSRERYVISRLGFKVELLNEAGFFVSDLQLSDTVQGIRHHDLSALNKVDVELKEALYSFLAYLIQSHLSTTVNKYVDFLILLSNVLINEKKCFEDSVDQVIAASPGVRGVNISCAKKLVEFLTIYEYPDLSYDYAENLLGAKGYASLKNNYLFLFMMDERRGPFTRDEVRILEKAVKDVQHPVKIRLVVRLMLNWGLRPIQLALLKCSDYVVDERMGVAYLKIPRVKNRTTKRRMQFVPRLLDAETIELITLYFLSIESDLRRLNLIDPPLFLNDRDTLSKYAFAGLHGYILTHRENRKKALSHGGLDEYFYHHTPQDFWRYLDSWSSQIPMSPRTRDRFNLNPYRFRYTVGTHAVEDGCTPEEVAELLDHEGANCVKHYFRFTQETAEILERSVESRIEQGHLSAAWMRNGSLEGNLYAKAVYEPRMFTAIGKCGTESMCFDEPAVACYACEKFCPNKDLEAHENAMSNLMARKESLLERSAPNVVAAMDDAIMGCRAAIALSTGGDVILINEN